MATSDSTPEQFDTTATRAEDMQQTIERWLSELTELVEEARASDEFQTWLDVHSRFHRYSPNNTLLIRHQCPEATRVAGYRTWQAEFDRQVKRGESAIWIWAPIVTSQCPVCENAPSRHDRIGCDYDETPPAEWTRGCVGFKPVPVFDVAQTEGEPLPKLATAAHGEGSALVPVLQRAAETLDIDVALVSPEEWHHGEARGICTQPPGASRPVVNAQKRPNQADLAVTLVHEYAHALLHVGVEDDTERTKREVEAEAVAYVVGTYLGLDPSGSAFYLAAWAHDEPEAIRERLERISTTAETIIDAVESDSTMQ